MLLSNRRLALFVLASLSLAAGLVGTSVARADDEPKPAAPAADQATSEAQIAQWIKELDSDLFATRQSAAQKLQDAGQPAIKAVSEAASSQSLEVATQAIEILRRMLNSDQKPLHDAAKGALEELAKGDNAAAGRAREALAPPPASAQPAQNNGIPFGPGGIIIPNGGGIQIGIGGNIQVGPGGGAQVMRIHTTFANGKTTTEVDENGKKIKIEKDQNNGIEMSITEKVNGQDKTDTYKAKDADELKKKSPEAYKLYERFGQGAGRLGQIQIQAQAIPVPFGGGAVPLQGIPRNALPFNNQPTEAQKEAAKQVEEARKLVADATDQLKQVGQPADAEAAKQKALGELEDALNKLDAAQQKLKR